MDPNLSNPSLGLVSTKKKRKRRTQEMKSKYFSHLIAAAFLIANDDHLSLAWLLFIDIQIRCSWSNVLNMCLLVLNLKENYAAFLFFFFF